MDLKLAKDLVQIRQFEESLLDLFAQGRLHGTVHTCIGQELVATAVSGQLQKSDWVFSNHRCHGHYLAWNHDRAGLLAEIMGRSSGVCAGRGGSQHICRDQFLSNGVQGGGVPIAAGCAMALRGVGGNRSIAVAFIGDGTLGEGVLYETLNLAAKWSLPLLIVIERNGYAQSTRTTETIAGAIGPRFQAFGWKHWEASIWNQEDLHKSARAAIEHVRASSEPVAISIECYRLKAHSKGDDNRSKQEIEDALARDPLTLFSKANPSEYARISEESRIQLSTILHEIESSATDTRSPRLGPNTPPEVLPLQWAMVDQQNGGGQRVLERLRTGLRELLSSDGRVILLGEDIEDPYGGAFKVTKGLSTAFPGRVRNTPISEAAIVGLGNGLALAGRRPVVEIMFGDFITLAADQLINQASKFAYMYNNQVSVPVVVRTPMGGKRGYGATHSQSLERHFFGTPGLTIVCVNSVLDPADLLRRVHQVSIGPCLFIENKLTYSSVVHHRSPDGRHWEFDNRPFPTLRLSAGDQIDVTLVTYGGMLDECEEAARIAFEEHEIAVEILVPTCIYPLDHTPLIDSVRRSGRLLTVEEGQGFSGFGSEVVARCTENGLAAVARRICAAPHPIPCARDQECNALPGTDEVLRALRSMLNR